LIAARLTRASGSLRFSITFQYPRDYGAREGYWNTSRGMNVGGLLFACLLLCCFLAFSCTLDLPVCFGTLFFSLVSYYTIPVPFRSIPYHTVRAERERAGPGGNRFRLRSGVCSFFFYSILCLCRYTYTTRRCLSVFFVYGLSPVMHDISCRHTRSACLLSRRLSLLSSNTFLIQDLSEVAGGLLPFLPLFLCVLRELFALGL
jgi:hypothetical protein